MGYHIGVIQMICLLTYRVFYKAVLAWLGSALLVCYFLQNRRCRFVLLLKLLLTPVSRTPSSVTQTQTQNSYKYTNIHTYIHSIHILHKQLRDRQLCRARQRLEHDDCVRQARDCKHRQGRIFPPVRAAASPPAAHVREYVNM